MSTPLTQNPSYSTSYKSQPTYLAPEVLILGSFPKWTTSFAFILSNSYAFKHLVGDVLLSIQRINQFYVNINDYKKVKIFSFI